MKNNEQLTTLELIDWIKNAGREMNSLELSNRNLPNAINRAKANALLAKSAIQAALYSSRNGVNLEVEKVLPELEQQPKKLLKDKGR
jgi:hypothetical protein